MCNRWLALSPDQVRRGGDTGFPTIGAPFEFTERYSAQRKRTKFTVHDPRTEGLFSEDHLWGWKISVPVLLLHQLSGGGIHAADTVTLDGSSTLNLEDASLRIDGGVGGHLNFRSGTFRIQAGTLLTMGGATLRVSRTGRGVLLVDNGFGKAGNDLIVGGLAGTSGFLELRSGDIQVHGLLQVADDVRLVEEIYVQGGTFTSVQTTSRIGDDGSGVLRLSGGVVQLADVRLAEM